MIKYIYLDMHYICIKLVLCNFFFKRGTKGEQNGNKWGAKWEVKQKWIDRSWSQEVKRKKLVQF